MAKRKTPSIDKKIFDATPSRIQKMSTAELIKLGQESQGWMNKRIRNLGEFATVQTTSGQRVRPKTNIKSRKSAIGAIQRARSMQSNPLSKRENIDELLRKAGETSLRGNKIVLDPNTGKPTIVSKDEAGRTWESPGSKKNLLNGFDNFKKWAEENTNWDSSEIVNRFFMAKDKGKDPIKFWEEQLGIKKETESGIDKFLKIDLESPETVDQIFPRNPSYTTRKEKSIYSKPSSIKISRGSRTTQLRRRR